MNYQCVIFDLDGTLLYTLDDIATAVNLTLAEFGYPTHDDDAVKSFINNGAIALMRSAMPEYARDDETVYRVLERYLVVYEEHINEKTYAYDGLAALCRTLIEKGVKLGVVSNKPDAHTKILAKHYFGEATFGYLSGTGIGLPTKPDALCVTKALESLGATKEQTLYVGDSHVDVDTARNGGLQCAGVLWGFKGIDSFTSGMPDFLVVNATELEQLILGV